MESKNQQTESPVDPFMRIRAVLAATSLSQATIYRMVSKGTFPRPVKLGERAVAWPQSKVVGWIKARTESKGLR